MANQTVYVHNLPEKIPKEDLKKCMLTIFSQFGNILDIVALKTYRLRGQAWVVFEDVAAATEAIRVMQNFPLQEKPMKLSYAKTKSDAIAKLDGSYVPKDKTERQKQNKAARDRLMNRSKTKAAAPVGDAAMAQAGPLGSDAVPANKILFVQNLPPNTNNAMVAMLFQQFPGFREVRMVEARPGIAFVEYDDTQQSAAALAGLQEFKIAPTHAMAISYAKQ